MARISWSGSGVSVSEGAWQYIYRCGGVMRFCVRLTSKDDIGFCVFAVISKCVNVSFVLTNWRLRTRNERAFNNSKK